MGVFYARNDRRDRLAIAAVQILVHLIYFLHLDPKSEAAGTCFALVFTGIILAIVLIGSSLDHVSSRYQYDDVR